MIVIPVGSRNGNGNDHVGIIIAIVLSVIVGCACILGVIAYMIQRRKSTLAISDERQRKSLINEIHCVHNAAHLLVPDMTITQLESVLTNLQNEQRAIQFV